MASAQVFNQDYRIPDRLVGLVIGRGGEQIKRLQQDSQCKIRIASESDGTAERACTLTGSQEAINSARQMLDEVIQRGLSRENNNNNNGGNRQYNRNNSGNGYQHRNNNNGGGGVGFHGNHHYNNNYNNNNNNGEGGYQQRRNQNFS